MVNSLSDGHFYVSGISITFQPALGVNACAEGVGWGRSSDVTTQFAYLLTRSFAY